MIVVVDSDNVITGTAPRPDVNANKWWHRASYVYIYSTEQKGFIIQKRTATKGYCPSYFDIANGGVLGADDGTDKMGAMREIEEELGIDINRFQQDDQEPNEGSIELIFVNTIPYEIENDNFFCNIYLMKLDLPFEELKIQEEEVEFLECWSIDKIKANITQGAKITPDSIKCFKELMKHQDLLAKVISN